MSKFISFFKMAFAALNKAVDFSKTLNDLLDFVWTLVLSILFIRERYLIAWLEMKIKIVKLMLDLKKSIRDLKGPGRNADDSRTLKELPPHREDDSLAA